VLLVLAKELSRLASLTHPPCRVELYHVRTKLASCLIRHLMEEDWMIYPMLMKSPDQALRQAAHAMQLQTGELGDAFRAYMRRWTTEAIEHDWPAYSRETLSFLSTLERRIAAEDSCIYNERATYVPYADGPARPAAA
jgi:hypothetical protein